VTEGVTVTLTPSEALQAAYGGVHRRLRAIFRGRQHRYGRGEGDEWESDVQACAAELAAARVLDRFWADSAALDPEGDVGSLPPQIHVRHTPLEHGRLILRPNDPDGVFVLVVGALPTFRVVGWLTSAEGKVGEPADLGNGRPPCWAIAQSSLRSVAELQR
jgi:hypothetical protein